MRLGIYCADVFIVGIILSIEFVWDTSVVVRNEIMFFNGMYFQLNIKKWIFETLQMLADKYRYLLKENLANTSTP